MKGSRQLTKFLRIGIPSALIIVWFALAGIGGPYFGKISEVASNDQSAFLPASAESTKLNEEIKKFQDENSIPAIIVFGNGDSALPPNALKDIATASQQLATIDGVAGKVSPPIPSQDGKAAIVVANMASGTAYKQFVASVRSTLDAAALPVTYKVSGPVGFLYDLGGAFSGIDGLLLGVALAVVFVILLIVYRSPLLPFVVLLNAVFALCVAILIVFYLAKADIVTLNGQVQGILFILVIGAATDYSLLFVARYREELTRHKEAFRALLESWKRSFEPIIAAGSTVIAGLLCLLLSDLTSNKALGPVGAIGILLAITATLTFLPSLLMAFGRKVFWPRTPQYQDALQQAVKKVPQAGIWQKVAHLIKSHPRRVWVITALSMLVMTAGLFQLRADGVSQSDFILGKSEARDGQHIIEEHFPGGSGAPVQVILAAAKSDEAVTALKADPSVASVSASPKIVDNEVLIEATLNETSDSEAAQATVERLRTALHGIDANTRVGGVAAVQLDTRKSSEHDRMVVIPAVLVVITIILMVLLRSILAPILLLLTTLLSFGAILGLSALVFNHLLGFPGADPAVVLYGFVFLVALGIDYNIFLMTRVREESLKHGTRKGTLLGLTATGGVITSAGIVLAATFAALAVIPILFLVQLAFIVSLGVLLDTIVVRSLLVPALSYDIGNRIWWPSRKINKK